MKKDNPIQKIFNSFDFMFNKIIRVKTDTPPASKVGEKNYEDEKELVANKEYVDIASTYDTPTAEQKQSSTIFPWVKNVFGLSLKELFDLLLFSEAAINYKNPTVKQSKVTVLNQYLIPFDNGVNHTNLKYLLWSGQNINVRFNISLNPSDRISGEQGKIKVYSADGALLYTFSSTSTSETESEINCSFIYTKDLIIKYERKYNKVHGSEELNEYTLEYDLSDTFKNECVTLDSFLTYLRADKGDINLNPDDYTISNLCVFGPTVEGIFDIAIPKPLISKYELEINYDMRNLDTEVIFATGVLKLYNLTKVESGFIKNGIEYNLYRFNFGTTEINTEAYLYPHFLRIKN